MASGRSRRGISVKLGEPAQELSFLLRWSNNNTFVYGPKCDTDQFSEEECDTFRGGFYLSDNSSTHGSPSSSYEAPSDLWDDDTYTMFTETISLGDNFTIKDFPMARPIDTEDWALAGFTPQHIIGMAPGSTFMNALVKGGRIASRSFGYFWGLDSGDSDQDTPGSFVLGGYDRAKTYGDGVRTDFSEGEDAHSCRGQMVVSIRDIVLNFRNGTDVSIFGTQGRGSSIDACIIPQNPSLMDLPEEPYFHNLMEAIDNKKVGRSMGLGVDYFNVLLDPEQPVYDGDITFKLKSGLDITVPNDQFIAPERRIDDAGEIYANESQHLIRINPMGGDLADDKLPSLGRYFFTAAYLASNEDAREFYIWRANPTSDEDLVAVDETNEVVDASYTDCAIQVVPGSDKDGETTQDGDEEGAQGGGGLSDGAKAGIGVGVGVPAIAGVACLAWWLLRRARARAKEDGGKMASSESRDSSRVSEDVKPGFPSQGYPHYIPQELPTTRPKTPPPSEMPT
ncbi:hypothetical protein ACJ41O_011747 [Fusarium nematophilum]